MSWKRWRFVLGVGLCGLVITGLLSLLLPQRPPARAEIVVLAGDLRNAGVLGVLIGIEQASEALDWGVTIFDLSRSNLSTSQEGVVEGYRRAFALRPDGLVLVSGNI